MLWVYKKMKKKQKKLNVFDRVSYHVYFENPDNATERIKALRATVKSYDEDRSAIIGYFGIFSQLFT